MEALRFLGLAVLGRNFLDRDSSSSIDLTDDRLFLGKVDLDSKIAGLNWFLSIISVSTNLLTRLA